MGRLQVIFEVKAYSLVAFAPAIVLSDWIVGANPTILYATLTGSLLGTAIIPTKDSKPIIPAELTFREMWLTLSKVLGLGLAIFAYAYFAAAGLTWALDGGPLNEGYLSICVMAGMFTRPFFPMIQSMAKSGVRARIRAWLGGDDHDGQ